MSRADCPCGFPPSWGQSWGEWHAEHEAAHLAAFPAVDERTRRNLSQLTNRQEPT